MNGVHPDSRKTSAWKHVHHGVYTFDNFEISGSARVATEDEIIVLGTDSTTLTLDGVRLKAHRLQLGDIVDLNLTGGTLEVSELVGSNLSSMTIDNSIVILHEIPTVTTLTLRNAAVLTLAGATTTTEPRLELAVVDTLSVDATSLIDASGKGYLGGRSGDNSSADGRTLGNALGATAREVFSPCCGSDASGGGYGGLGGLHSLTNDAYGDFRSPNELGSGGASFSANEVAQNGGGLVRILANVLELDGAILANGGGVPASGAGGSGGGIFIDTAVLTGSGTVSANGSSSSSRAAGGGGRVAAYYDNASGFTGEMTAHGGSGPEGNGGAGTLFTKASAQSFGDLIVDNDGLFVAGGSTPLRAVGPGTSTGVAANVLTDTTATFAMPNPTTGALGLVGLELNPHTAQNQEFTVVDNTASQIFTSSADGDMTLVAMPGNTYIGVYRFNNLSVIGRARVFTGDNVFAEDTLLVDPLSMLVSNNVNLP